MRLVKTESGGRKGQRWVAYYYVTLPCTLRYLSVPNLVCSLPTVTLLFLSFNTLPCLILPSLPLPYLTLYLNLRYLTLYLTLPHTISYLTLIYLTLLYTLPYLIPYFTLPILTLPYLTVLLGSTFLVLNCFCCRFNTAKVGL